MRRSLVILITSGLLLLGSLAFATGASAATIGSTTSCSNGSPDTAGLGLICRVWIVNRITGSGGSATVRVRECHGAAGAPTAACKTTVRTLTQPVTRVTQCNSVLNGGGGTLRCSVSVTNNFVNLATGKTAATINQCVRSGGGIANDCDPFPAHTTNATITQCNGSANGGTLVQLKCTASGTKPSSNGVRINQCNGSANGGGSLVICSARIVNNRVAASTTGGSTTTGPTPPATDTVATTTDVPRSGTSPLGLIGIFLFALVAVSWRPIRRGGTPRA